MLEINAVVFRVAAREVDVLLVNTQEKLTLSPEDAVALAEQLLEAARALTDSPENGETR